MVILNLLFIHIFEFRIKSIIFPNMLKVINSQSSFFLVSSKAIEQEPSMNKQKINSKHKVKHKQNNTQCLNNI